MTPLPDVSQEKYLAEMRAELEEVLRKVVDAVNAAEAGRIIADSEEPVRELFGEFQRKAYQRALQMKGDAAEASFPPSAGPDHREAAPQQRSAGL